VTEKKRDAVVIRISGSSDQSASSVAENVTVVDATGESAVRIAVADARASRFFVGGTGGEVATSAALEAMKTATARS
jgi:hypothetical protein